MKGMMGMKKRTRAMAIGLAAMVSLVMPLGVSGADYPKYLVNETFQAVEETNFLLPGDVNADRSLNAADSVHLSKLLLGVGGVDEKYSDVNGDGALNVIDLIRQKKNSANYGTIIADGEYRLNGKSIYGVSLYENMRSGAEYRVVMKYSADSDIKVIINGVEMLASSADSTFEYDFTAPLTIDREEDYRLEIVGTGTVSHFSIQAVNTDNELVENW